MSAKSWIDVHCAKCEQERFNQSTVNACYEEDENIQKVNSKLNNYRNCVMQLTFEIKKSDQKLDVSMKSFEKQENISQENSLHKKVCIH